MNSANSNAPHIGFDRFIPLDWATCALHVRAGQETSETLEALIGEKERSEASRKKTRSVLKGLWLAPRADLAPFADREAALRYTGKAMSVATLQSSAVLYPFSLDQPLAFVASKSPALELRADGSRSQIVAIQ